MSPFTTITSYSGKLRKLTWAKIKGRIRSLFFENVEERIFRMTPREALDLPETRKFERDRWDDLMLFFPEEHYYREDRLKEWRSRLDRGEHVYTQTDDGKLVGYGWMIERQKLSRMSHVRQTLELPDDCAVVYDFYTIPEYRNTDCYQSMLIYAMREAAQVPNTKWIHLSVRADNPVPRWWVERLGAEYRESLCFERRLWRARAWRQKID